MGKYLKTTKKVTPKSKAKKAALGGVAKTAALKLRKCPPKSGPGSDTHRLQRWKEYKGTWNKKAWTNVYFANMVKASVARKAVEAYQKTLGWGTLEVSVPVPASTNTEGKTTRRLDIADKRTKPTKAIEHKTGYICLSESIQSEVDRDAWLVSKGMDITWHFEGTASQPLIDELTSKGIKITP
jgi:hypothetical protein